jgi:hypothetical protein
VSRSERVICAGSFSSCSPWRNRSRVLGAACREVANSLSFGGTLFRVLGRREASVVMHAGYAFLLRRLRVEKGVEFGFDFFGHSYVLWVLVHCGTLQRGIRVCF